MLSYDKLIFEVSKKGRIGYSLPKCDVEDVSIDTILPKELLREEDALLPEVSENEVVRHFTLLSNKNFGVDSGFYPLGSCTMKYNPKINEDMAALNTLQNIHPYQEEETVQGALEIMYDLNCKLSEITGMDYVSLQPAAGAHGELTGLMIIKAYHDKREDKKRTKIIVPDSAHGTNPASANVAGFEIVEVKSNENGGVDIESLKSVLNDEIAGLMLTNPNTLGIFDPNIKLISSLVHEAGGLVYYDGANLNAVMGKSRPGDMGFDVVHLNLHKTFAAPHGGGGPGSGPVGVKKHLIPFVPVPVVEKTENSFVLNYDKEDSIGKVKSFYGNFGVMVKSYAYILTMGAEGLRKSSETAVLNANYLQKKLKDHYNLPYDGICKHEFVLGGLKEPNGVGTLDVAKRLLDYGYHPPTIYFPLIVDSAIMIEPTESESLETLDGFADSMISISEEAKKDAEILHSAPLTTPLKRLDEVKAARSLILKWEDK